MTLQQIDILGDEFESALRNGDTVRIEDILPKIDESQRSDLLNELLEVEIQFIAKGSMSDDARRNALESFMRRFPEKVDFVQSLFQRFTKLQRVGDYEILGELGHGGMGIVYKAKHKLLQQTVAIKVLSQALLDDSQAVGRFKREMQLIGGLTHPNIVRALNAGEVDGVLYLAMEFVEGFTLQKLVEYVRVKDNGSKDRAALPIISLGAACEAVRQAALGLQNVHELKLIHRDIKPANLMLDYHGTVKILDLGLGKFAEERINDYHSSLTMPGMVLGTVDYISPEQCENSGEADIRSDLYSLGCSLYFLLTGKPVYSGSRYDTMRKKLMAHIVGDVPTLRQEIPELPKEIETILQKVLAKDPAERFQTPIEFAEALAPFAAPDELWAVINELLPKDTSGSSSGARYSSSPYGSLSLKKQPVSPISRPTWTPHLLSLCLLSVAVTVSMVLYFIVSQHNLTAQAVRAEENARKHREQWQMVEARNEYQKAARIRLKEFTQTNDLKIRKILVQNQIDIAMMYWYCGDSARARQDMRSIQNRIEDSINQDAQLEAAMSPFQRVAQERLADFTLFGGIASERNRERFTNAITLYSDVAKAKANDSPNKEIRWKQAILLSLQGDWDRAVTLLEQNPVGNDAELYSTLVYELAEAVIFYHQRASGSDAESATRCQKLRTFQGQFTLQNDPARGAVKQAEILELLLFCAEFLIYDSIKHEDWETLARDVTAINLVTANFLRQYPGSIPFMRRYYEILVRAAALLHEKMERPGDKRTQINNIVGLLDRIRPSKGGDNTTGRDTGRDRATLILFYLPDTNKPEEGFVLFYPRDDREGTLYPLLLTRQQVKQREWTQPELAAVLPDRLLVQFSAEKGKVRISWDDSASWSRKEDTLTESDYPFKDILPLQ